MILHSGGRPVRLYCFGGNEKKYNEVLYRSIRVYVRQFSLNQFFFFYLLNNIARLFVTRDTLYVYYCFFLPTTLSWLLFCSFVIILFCR